MISLNGGTLQGHQLPVASSKQEDQHQQIVERQRKESAAFAIRKVGISYLKVIFKGSASAPRTVLCLGIVNLFDKTSPLCGHAK